MYFGCDDSKISCDDKLDEASKCITGSFRALGHSSVLWDVIFRRPSRLQTNTSLLLDLAAHLVLNEFQLILLHQTCAFAISFPSNFLRSPCQLYKWTFWITPMNAKQMSKGRCKASKAGAFSELPCKCALMLVPIRYRGTGWLPQDVSSPAF